MYHTAHSRLSLTTALFLINPSILKIQFVLMVKYLATFVRLLQNCTVGVGPQLLHFLYSSTNSTSFVFGVGTWWRSEQEAFCSSRGQSV